MEGGSSDDELQTAGRNTDTRTGIEHRCSAEGQVINSPITGKVLFIKYKKLCLLNKITGISSLCFSVASGDGGGGDGSSGSDEEGNDGGVSTVPLPPTTVQSTYDVLRGLGIVGGSGETRDDDQLQTLLSRSGMIMHDQVKLVACKQLIMINVELYVFKQQENAI